MRDAEALAGGDIFPDVGRSSAPRGESVRDVAARRCRNFVSHRRLELVQIRIGVGLVSARQNRDLHREMQCV